MVCLRKIYQLSLKAMWYCGDMKSWVLIDRLVLLCFGEILLILTGYSIIVYKLDIIIPPVLLQIFVVNSDALVSTLRLV